jgi:hypothetical protein
MKEFSGGKEAAETLTGWIEALAMMLAAWIMQTLFRRRHAPQPVPARHQPMPVEPTLKPQAAPTGPEPRSVWNDRTLRAKADRASERLKADSDRKWQAVYLKRYLQRKLSDAGTRKLGPHPKAHKLAPGLLAWANTIDGETAHALSLTPTATLAREIARIGDEGAQIAAKAIDPTITRPNAMPPQRPAWLEVQASMEAAQAQAAAQAIVDAEFACPSIDPTELEAVPDDFGGMLPEISPDDLEPLAPTSP